MSVSKRGSGYLMAAMIDGKRHRHTFTTATEAEAFEAELRLAAKFGKPMPVASVKMQGTTLGALCDLVTEKHWRGLKSEETLSRNGRLYVRFVGNKVAVSDAFAEAQLRDYVLSLERAGLASGTVNRRLAAVSVMAKEAKRQGQIASLPELKWQREGMSRIRFYSQDEVAAILGETQRLGYFDYARLFAFLVDTGARLGEAEGLAWADCSGSTVTFCDTKNGETRAVPMTTQARRAAQVQKSHSAWTGPFSGLSRNTLRVLWEKLRGTLPWMGADTVVHTFRHTCASRLVQAGHDLYHVQRWMGHKSLTMTMRYAHLAPKTYGAMAASLEVGATGVEPVSPKAADFKSASFTSFDTPPKVYGPYLCADGRMRIVHYDLVSKSRRTESWPRYVWSQANGAIPEGYEVDHKDGNPMNNDIDNLQLLTVTENRQKQAFDFAFGDNDWGVANRVANDGANGLKLPQADLGYGIVPLCQMPAIIAQIGSDDGTAQQSLKDEIPPIPDGNEP